MDTQKTEAPNAHDDEAAVPAGPTRPLTVTIRDDLLTKLRVVAVLRDQPVSAVVEGYIAKLVKQDLKRLASKLED
jgi:hypothetical protein